MKKFDGYDDVKPSGFEERESLKVGGHYCKISEATIIKDQTKDGKPYEALSIKFDIAEPDEQAGFYERKYKKEADADALKAKWRGVYQQFLPTDDGSEADEKTKSYFKGLITSIEKSNPGYEWNWEENTLVGKMFGGVFGLEEFNSEMVGKITFNRLRFIRSTEKIEEAYIPKVKLLDGTYVDYEEYIEKFKAEKNADKNNSTAAAEETSIIGDNDDLPF